MTAETHSQLANFIWSICNLLRGPYKRNEYRKVILPLTVLRRFDCILEPTKNQVLSEYETIKTKPETVIKHRLEAITKRPFYNVSKLTMRRLLDDPNQLAANLNSYINDFSPNVRVVMQKFAFAEQIARMSEKNLLYQVLKEFVSNPKIDLSPNVVSNLQMGYVFEELIRIGAEQSNEEAGEHFTPREVIKLMVNLLLSSETDVFREHIVKTIYDCACGTGGMLSVAESYLKEHNSKSNPLLYGQDYNDDAWAVCKSDMLIKGEDVDHIVLGDTFLADGFKTDDEGRLRTFDYMLANPPFGVEWKQQQKVIEAERDTLGYAGRFGAGLPRINDGALLFLQHMISKMRAPADGGSRIAIVFNGSPLFTGDAGSGESEIRKWIIENDWLETIVALPDQLFYNTGISTYIWLLTNRKEPRRVGKIQLIDARNFWVPMKKSFGNKRHKIGEGIDGEPDQIGEVTRIHGAFTHGDARSFALDSDGKPVTARRGGSSENGGAAKAHRTKRLIVSKIFDNDDFGYHKITVERPLRLSFQATEERIARLDEEPIFKNLATSNKKNAQMRLDDVTAGEARQQEIRDFLAAFRAKYKTVTFLDRSDFLNDLKSLGNAEGIRLSAPEVKAIVNALGERDEAAEVCRLPNGGLEPDPELRDTETVPLKEDIDAYVAREVLPHVPDAWIDHTKTKPGYEIPLNRQFYVYEPPRPLEQIEGDIKTIETDIIRMLAEVTA